MDKDELIARGYSGGYEAFRNKWIGDHEEMILDLVRDFVPRVALESRPAPTEERAREVLAQIVEEMAVKGGYKANDIRAGNLTSEDERTIAAMLRFATETQPVAGGEQAPDAAKYADMGTDERAKAMADDCVGDPWELLGYFREKLRQAEWEGDHARSAALELAQKLAATRAKPTTPERAKALEDRFWLVLQEPGRIPERKGPWKHSETARILREFMAARPTAYIHVLSLGDDGTPHVDHGPEVLQMIDGRSMSTGRAHNQRTRKAHDAALSASPPEVVEDDGSNHGKDIFR